MSWPTVKLGDICDLQNGYAFKSNDYVEESNVLNCRMSNIRPDGDFDIFYHPKYLPDDYAKKYKDFLLRDDDVIIAMTDMAGEPKILGVPTIVRTHGKVLLLNQRVGKLIFKKPDGVNFNYLKYVLSDQKVRNFYRKFANGGVQINLSKPDLLSVLIPLPPLAEQKRIAEILDKADAIRRKREQTIAKLDQLAQSIFVEMFGDPVKNSKSWTFVKLGELVEKIGSGATPTGGDAAYKEFGISLIRSLNVHDGEFRRKNLAYIDETQARKLANVEVKAGDVLLNITGASVARVCRAPEFVLPARVNQHVMIIRPNKSLNNVFLERLLLNKQVKYKLLAIGGAGATREAITKAQAQGLKIISPPLALQQQFANRIEKLEQLKADNVSALALHKQLFASLQHQAFTGQLAL